jgi:glycosyltransferase involved in cell wall biosynthesis
VEYLRGYVASGCVDSFALVSPHKADKWADVFSRLAVYPGAKNFLRRKRQSRLIKELISVVHQYDRAVLILSDRAFLFAVPELSRHIPVVIDWCDSVTLAVWRLLRLDLSEGHYGRIPELLHSLIANLCEERYYPGYAQANMVVSPADRDVLNRLSSADISIVPMGVDRIVAPQVFSKVPGRLVFTGVMSFEPNYRSILWFIDHVLPLVRAARADAHLVVAGRDPVPELLARQSEHIAITGAVPDLATEIAAAQIYVAPMRLGSGFKNKVVEALAAGTPVIGTNMANEFLPNDLKHAVVVADAPENMANEIVAALEQPAKLISHVIRAQEILRDRYSWLQCTRGLMSLLDAAGMGELKADASVVRHSE